LLVTKFKYMYLAAALASWNPNPLFGNPFSMALLKQTCFKTVPSVNSDLTLTAETLTTF